MNNNTKVKRPIWRNPFFWGAVVGIIAIPLIRPLTRRVPPPPPISGALPTVTLTNVMTGATINLTGQVHILAFVDQLEAVTALVPLAQRFAATEVKIDIIVIPTTADTPEKIDPDLGGKTSVSSHLKLVPLATNQRTAITDVARKQCTDEGASLVRCLLIIDRSGNFRGGGFSPHAEQHDEVFHRAIHVMLENEG